MATKKITPVFLQDLLLMKVQALYDVEHELVDALPTMSKKATDNGLAEAFSTHLDETKMHIERLERVFDVLDKKSTKLKAEGVRGIVEDAEWMIKKITDLKARDAAMIAAAEQAEMYEISIYRVAIIWADMLGFNDIQELLDENLAEEEAALQKLESLGSEGIFEATAGDDTEEEMEEEEM